MTVIEIRPYRNGWKVFEAPRVEPVFPEKDQAINLRAKLRELSLRGDSARLARALPHAAPSPHFPV
jgi:hypothetical protein